MASPPILPRGTRVGKYEIRDVIAVGMGGGVVYRARDAAMPRIQVCIKALPRRDKDMIARFEREADILGTLESRHAVKVLSYGHIDEDLPYIVMELLRGENLEDRLKKVQRLSVPEAVDIVIGISSALWACHLNGFVHRDIKPANIFLHKDSEGEMVKLIDFGISLSPMAPPITQMGHAPGTVPYMSPEQLSTQSADERTDQFSLGVVLYLCLAGKLPWPPEPLAAHYQTLMAGKVTPITEYRQDLPAELIPILERSIALSRDDRFPTIREFALRLRPFASGAVNANFSAHLLNPALPPPISAVVTSPGAANRDSVLIYDTGPTKRSRHRKKWVLVGAGAGAIVAIAVGGLITRSPDVPEGAKPESNRRAVAAVENAAPPSAEVVRSGDAGVRSPEEQRVAPPVVPEAPAKRPVAHVAPRKPRPKATAATEESPKNNEKHKESQPLRSRQGSVIVE